MPIVNHNELNYIKQIKSILNVLMKKYALVVIDTLNGPYPGYEGYIHHLEEDVLYLSHIISDDPYVIIPLINIIDVYATNVEVEVKDLGKIRDKIEHYILKDCVEKSPKDKVPKLNDLKDKKHNGIYNLIYNLLSKQDDSLLLKIYTKSMVYQVYDEINLKQINTVTNDFLFIYQLDISSEQNNEIIIIFPLKSIDSIVIYSDIKRPLIVHSSKGKSIKNLYENSKDVLNLAKQNSNDYDSN